MSPFAVDITVAVQAWNNAVAQSWKRIQSDDPVHALARAMREGRGDTVMVKPQWNMPIPGEGGEEERLQAPVFNGHEFCNLAI